MAAVNVEEVRKEISEAQKKKTRRPQKNVVGAAKTVHQEFRPKSFDEFWSFVLGNIKKSCTSEGGHFLKEKYESQKKELKPIAKDLWKMNADRRENFYKYERKLAERSVD